MLLERYAPKDVSDFVGNKQQLTDIRKWLDTWKKGSSLIIYGPTGVGKSIAVQLIAKERDCGLIESHASDDRTQKNFAGLIKSTKQQGLVKKKKIILIDEADMLDSVKPINEIINTSEFPVILIMSDPYNKRLYNVRKRSRIVKFDKIRHDEIATFLWNVCEHQGIECNKSDILQLARISNGDMRSALIDLELFTKMPMEFLGQREQKGTIFELLKIIMKTKSMDNARLAIKNSGDMEELIAWISENLPEEYRDSEDLAKAYDYLSKADVFYARIMKRQSWGLQKYVNDLSVIGTAMSKKRPSAGFVMYKVPKIHYRNNRKALRKIGQKLHTSSKKSVVYLPIIKKQMKNVAKKLDLDEDDIESLTEL